MNKQEAIKKINLEMFAYPNLEPEEDDGPPIDFKNGYNAASKANIKIINQLNESRGASWQDAIEILEDHFSCEIPRNLDQVIEGFKSMSGLMNSVEFELDKRGSKLTSKEFVIEALERYKHKVKVPAYVAEWIERNKSGDVQLIIILKYFGQWYEMNENENLNDEICKWVIENSETFMRAWLDGYEVEEEPKYYIRLTIPNSSVIGLYLGFNKDGKFDTSYGKPHITWGWKCRFTEKEIKAIDERYWPFAVPVEKV